MLVGVDEVGRGAWAGPVVAAAVLLQSPLSGLQDSKLLTKKQRKEMARAIYAHAQVGLGWVDAAVVDQIGLTKAITQAMEQAVWQITAPYEEVIIDGNFNFLSKHPKSRTVIKADQTIPAASAASIVAKVARDTFMVEQSALFPNFGFERHVGYGTKYHRQMLDTYGPCKLHRLSFAPLKRLVTL